MGTTARVTVSLSAELVAQIDAVAANRSEFFAQAAAAELKRRRRAALRESLEHPHPDSLVVAEEGLEGWVRGLPAEDAEGLVDPDAGTAVRWVPGEGWQAVARGPKGRTGRR